MNEIHWWWAQTAWVRVAGFIKSRPFGTAIGWKLDCVIMLRSRPLEMQVVSSLVFIRILLVIVYFPCTINMKEEYRQQNNPMNHGIQ